MAIDDELLQTVDGRYGPVSYFVNDASAVSRSLALYGEWAENEIAFMRHFICPGATILDIGAYLGTHTLAFARAAGPHGHVLSFEAQPLAFDILQRNVQANGLPGIELRNVVVADFAGTTAVPSIEVDQPGSFGSASLRSQLLPEAAGPTLGTGQSSSHDFDTPVVSIDSLELEACTLIKADVEGMEDLVLRGAQATIARFQPAVYVECNSIDDGLRSIAVLRTFGYDSRLHLVDAFNADNFNGSLENVFGRAREAALVGVPATESGRLDTLPLRPCELLIRIETADDLALALLNKPQYPSEILARGAAAATGAAAWLHETEQRQLDAERRVQSAREEREAASAQMEAAMRQARAARSALDEARAEAAMLRQTAARSLEQQEASHADERRRWQAEIDALNARLDAIYASTSWRLTRVVRLLGRTLLGRS